MKINFNVQMTDCNAYCQGVFFFSCIWALGGPLNDLSREKFSELFKALISKTFPEEIYTKYHIPDYLHVPSLKKPFIFPIPSRGTVFDYRFIKEGKGKWKLWSDEIDSAPPIPKDMSVNQIIITTVETIRITALLDLLLRHAKPLLLVGPTGTGKSVYTMEYLLKGIDTTVYNQLFINFSAQTSANQTQDIILSKLDKRRKGVFGPALGKKCIIFVDDVSMPLKVRYYQLMWQNVCMLIRINIKETYGAQPPIELLRMWLDHFFWYDRKTVTPLKLVDIQVSVPLLFCHILGEF